MILNKKEIKKIKKLLFKNINLINDFNFSIYFFKIALFVDE